MQNTKTNLDVPVQVTASSNVEPTKELQNVDTIKQPCYLQIISESKGFKVCIILNDNGTFNAEFTGDSEIANGSNSQGLKIILMGLVNSFFHE